MKAHVAKYLVVCLSLCVVAASGSCYPKPIPPPTANADKLFGKEPTDGVGSKESCDCAEDGFYSEVFRMLWDDLSSTIVNNWVPIAMCSLLPIVVFCENMMNLLQNWKKSFILKEKADTQFRRPTLPDLTLARHARRESLAESAQNHTNRPGTMSQCNILKNEEPGDSKRVHIIRRRH